MPVDNVELRCTGPQVHSHIVSIDQVTRLEREPCCWCHAPLYRYRWWNGDFFERAEPRRRPVSSPSAEHPPTLT